MKAFYRYAAGTLLGAGITIASAHTPYLLPNAFEPINGGLITLDASFAEHFFIPEVVFDSSEFEVRLPDGKTVRPDTVHALKSRIVVEHDLKEEGTYRFSTGRRIGRVFKTYELNGESIAMEDPDEPLPDGARLVANYQSNTMAEAYVTRGGPSEAALASRDDGLEYVPMSHPNDLFADESLDLQALFFGQPLPGLQVDVFLTGHGSADDAPVQTLTSSNDGTFTFTPRTAGIYLLRSRHRAMANPGAAAPEISHTYTLVVEAFR